MITGFSGAGKTLWAASQAQHSTSTVGYFDIRELPDTAFASSLAREMAARFLTGGPGNTARLPHGSGLDVLAALNQVIATMDARPIMVLDNIQRCRAEVIQSIINTSSNVNFVLLGQPGDHIAQFEALLGITHEPLLGWSRETLASVFFDLKIGLSPALARRWHRVTGGLPLYVESAARICAQSYSSDAGQFLEEIVVGGHAETVVQEVLLEQVLGALNAEEKSVIACLSLSNIQLSSDELGVLTPLTPNPPTNFVRTLRNLSRMGLVQRFSNNMWKLHDAVVVPAQPYLEELGRERIGQCQIALCDLFLASIQERQDLVRLAAWMRLLGPTGQANVLAEIATEEMFHEYGDPSDLKSILEELVSNENVATESQYWALEALAFWDLQGDPRHNNPRPRLARMQEIIDENPEIDPEGQLRIDIKLMMWGGSNGDFAIVRDSFANCRRHAAQAPSKLRLARYNYASAVHLLRDNRRALPIAERLYQEYYDLLNIDVAQVFGATSQQMRDLVGEITDEKQTNLKHLADCLSLTAKIKRGLGQHPRFLAIHAAKFYRLAGARRSEMIVAQDFADDTLDLGDAEGAVMAMENYVLPILEHFHFDDQFVEVNSHYAVLLAYAGRIDEARHHMGHLQPYFDTLPPEHQEGFRGQMQLIDALSTGRLAAPPRR